MKGSFCKVDGPFLPLTFPVPVTFTRLSACTFRKVWSTSTLKSFCRCSYIFEITTYPLMDKWFPLLLVPKHVPKHSFWGLNGTKYWRLFILEYLQPNKFKERPNFDPIYQVSCFFRGAMHHVSIYFQRKAALHFLLRKKRSCFRGKNTIFPDSTRKIICRRGTFWKDHIFRRSDENIIFPCIF